MAEEAIAKHDNFLAPIAATDKQLMKEMADSIGPEGLTFGDIIRITVPAGGGRFFEVPDLDGEVESVKEILGVVIEMRDIRRYYAKSGDEITPGERPDCSSEDGLIGVGDPGGECRRCPLNQWDSRPDGKPGKACAQRRLLFLLSPEIHLLPIVIDAPPSSLRTLKAFFTRLPTKGIRRSQAVVGFRLEKAKSKAGIDYSEIIPRLVATLTEDQEAEFLSYKEQFGIAVEASVLADAPLEG